MKRGPNDTAPMRLLAEPDRTDRGEPASVSTTPDTTEPGAYLPDVTPLNGTDPGLDPMLKAFNRPPRPPAPQPNLRSSSDGDEFAAHYASPRELKSPRAQPTAHVPEVLVQLALLARTDTAPMADLVADPALAVQRDVQTVVVPERQRVSSRTLLVAVMGGALLAAFGSLFFLGFLDAAKNPPQPPAAAGSSSAQPLVRPPSPELSMPSSAPVAIVEGSVAPSSPVAVPSALPAPSPVAPLPATRPTTTAPAARPASTPTRAVPSDQEKPTPARPAHETPNPVF